MKKAFSLTIAILLLLGLASISFADEAAPRLTLKSSGAGQWAIIDSGRQEIGTLAKMDEGAYSILPQGGQYLGVVKSNGELQLQGRHPTLNPSEARLYLDVLEAIKTLP